MNLEWRTVVKGDELWGWRLYDTGAKLHSQWRIEATVHQLLCETKREFKVWMFSVKVDRYRQMFFYTEEEAKAWAVAVVRM